MSDLATAVTRLARVPRSIGEDVAEVTDALSEAVACVQEMWRWQQSCQELLPEGLADRVQAILRRAGAEL